MRKLMAAWNAGGKDNLGLIAAGISYYVFLAMVPLLVVAVLTYGLVADPAMVAQHVAVLAQSLPQSAAELVGEQLVGVTEGRGSAKGLGLVVALAVSLFGARNGAGAIITALNIVFGVKDFRSILRATGLAIGITLGGIVTLAIVAGAIAATSGITGIAGTVAGYLLVGGAGFGAAALLYRVAPNRVNLPWRSIWPGALLFAITWLLATMGFGIYVANFGNYNATYGSLGAVVVLVTWFYLSAYFLLFGAEFSAQFARDRQHLDESFTDS